MMGYVQVLSAVLIWTYFNGVLVKQVKTSGLGVGTWTGLVGMILMTGFFLVSDKYFLLTRYQLWIVFWLLLSASLNNACNYTAIKMAGVANAMLFHYLAPMLAPVMVIGLNSFLPMPIQYEPISVFHVLALSGGLAGVIYLGIPNLKVGKKWMLLGLGSALFYSLEIVFSGYIMDDLKVPFEVAKFSKLSGQAIIMSLLAVVLNEKLSVESKNDWKKLILGGVLLYISFIFYFKGSQTVGYLERGILSYIDRIGAIALGIYFFPDEKLTKNIIIGGALIIGASVLLFF